jgi:hypothetical protein
MPSPPGGEPQRRSHPRIPLRLRVHLEFQEQRCFLSESATEISVEGMFIRSENPRKPGERFLFEARLGERGPNLGGAGEVVWARLEGSGASPGMGARIFELEDATRELLLHLTEVFRAGGSEGVEREVAALVAAHEARVEDDPTVSVPSSAAALQDPQSLPLFPQRGCGPVPEPLVPSDLLPDPSASASGPEQASKGALPPAPAPAEDQAPALAGGAPSAECEAVPRGAALTPVAAQEVLPIDPASPSEVPATAPLDLALKDGEPPQDRAAAPAAHGDRGVAPEPEVSAAPRRGHRALGRLLAVGGLLLLGGAGGWYLVRPQGADRSPVARVAPVGQPAAGGEWQIVGRANSEEVAATGEPWGAARPASPPGEFRAVRAIGWRQQGDALVVAIGLDGSPVKERIRLLRLSQGPPRVVLKLAGIAERYEDEQLEVGSSQVSRIRIGFHRGSNGHEQHLVFDLGGGEVEVRSLAHGESGIELLFAR